MNIWLKLYAALIITSGSAAVALSAFEATHSSHSAVLALLAVLTGVASLFPLKLPSFRGRDLGLAVSVSHILALCSLLFYGPSAFVLLAALDSLTQALRCRGSRRTVLRVFATTSAAWLAGQAYVLLLGGETGTAAWMSLGAATTLAWLAFFAARTLLALPFRPLHRLIWLRSQLTLGGFNLIGAWAALAVYLTFGEMALPALAIAVTLMAGMLYLKEILQSRVQELEGQVGEKDRLYRSTIETLALAVDARDQIGQGHLYRVRAMALQLARRLGVRNENDLMGLGIAALLHDIGKLATPEYILGKSGTLTEAEMETMEAHAAIGADILALVPFPYPVLPFVRHHHEKWDGTGYPEGLRRNEIPLGARVLAVVDCYDAMRSDRPYRPKLGRRETIDYIRSEAGRSFDPEIVQTLVAHLDELEAVAAQACHEGASVTQRLAVAADSGGSPIRSTVYQDIASAHQEVQAVQEISRAVGRLLTVSEMSSLLAEKIRSAVRFEACAVFLGAPGETLTCRFSAGQCASELEKLEIPSGHGVTGWVEANGRALVNVSPAGDFRLASRAAQAFKSCLSVPLLRDPNASGVVTLYSASDNGFNSSDLRLVSRLSQHAGTALRNSILYENTRKHAYSDTLTGLPNLRYFKVFAEQELRRAERANGPVTFLMMDLDRFKEINDQLGHKSGDEVLVHAARLLKREMRRSDTCIRYGGDEFIGILPGADRSAARTIIDKIQKAVAEDPVRLSSGGSVQVDISLGVSTFPLDSRELDQLLILADQDMYRNKLARSLQREASPVPTI